MMDKRRKLGNTNKARPVPRIVKGLRGVAKNVQGWIMHDDDELEMESENSRLTVKLST